MGGTFLIQSELLSVDFLGDAKARVLRVKLTSLSNRENQQQTQPTFGAKVGLEPRPHRWCTHHCLILPSYVFVPDNDVIYCSFVEI